MTFGALRGASMRVTVSVRRERLPRPGHGERAWAWDDLLATPPPSHAASRDAEYVVRHGYDPDERDPEVRVGYVTVVRAVVGPDGRPDVAVDERVAVEPRVLSGVLVVERAVTRVVSDTSKAGLRYATRGAESLSQRVGGKSGVALSRTTSATDRALRWAGRTLRDVARAVVEAPDRLWLGARTADAHLHSRRERRTLVRGLFAPNALSREEKAAALFVLLAAAAALAVVGTFLVVFSWPHLATAWREALTYFAIGVGSTVVFPFFPEFRLAESAAVLGAPGAILTVTLGMTIGGWFVLFLGDEVHASLRRSVTPGSAWARFLDRAEAFAARRGFWAALLVLAIPLGPDTPVFYMLATVRTPPLQYLAGTFLGCLARFSLWHTAFSGYYVA